MHDAIRRIIQDAALDLARRPKGLRNLPEPLNSQVETTAIHIRRERQELGESQLIFQDVTVENGVVRLMLQPEGYALWFHGELVWKQGQVKK